MTLHHLQLPHQAETILQLCPHNSRFGMLAIDREGFNNAILISHQEPTTDSVQLFAQYHLKQRPARTVYNWINGYHPNEEAMEMDYNKPPSPRPPCTGPQRESEGGAVQKSRGGGRWIKKCSRWESPGAAFEEWRRTGRSGGTTVLPYTPPGVMNMSWVSDTVISPLGMSGKTREKLVNQSPHGSWFTGSLSVLSTSVYCFYGTIMKGVCQREISCSSNSWNSARNQSKRLKEWATPHLYLLNKRREQQRL